MKITRRQLRNLINEVRVKAGDDMDPEDVATISSMIDSGDEEVVKQADELASLLGHERGDSFSQSLERYDKVSFMADIGEFITYLTDKDIQLLMNVKGKVLRYAFDGWSGFGFELANPDGYSVGSAISPSEIFHMGIRIAAKKKDPDDDDYDNHILDGTDEQYKAAHKLAQTIMSMSKKTYVDKHLIEDAGIGEELEERKSQMYRSTPLRRYKGSKYDFYEPEYEQLYKSGKLVIK